MEQDLTNPINFDLVTKIDPDLIVQIFLLVVLLFYGLFTLLVYKQVKILNRTIQTPTAGTVNKLALIQFVVTWLLVAVVILLILL